MFKKTSLGVKLVLAFLAVGIIPFAVVSIFSLLKSSEALSNQAFGQLMSMRGVKKAQVATYFAERQGDLGVLVETVGAWRREAFAKLEAVQEIKKAQLLDYFETMRTQLRILKDDPYVSTALFELDLAYKDAGNRVGTLEWEELARKYDGRLKDVTTDNGWYDLFLISKDGDIVYTVAREPDLGQNIPGSELKDTPLGQAYARAKALSGDEVAFADLAPYAPSAGAPAGFMMAPMKDASGTLSGYVAFQLPLDKINEIMLRRNGLGRTGESYLVGPDGLMRSDSYLDKEGHSVTASFKNGTKVETVAVKQALAGKDGQEVIIDYNGNPVLSCYGAVELGGGVHWAMMSEVDVAEAFSPVDEKGQEFFAKYTQMYGYYDLFLVNPDGYVFYTVAKEPDYQTNMVSGQYADSNLGRLIRKVLETRQPGLADFEPYAPSKGEPAAFMARPVVHEDKVEIVVALQLSLESLNNLMQQRDGMGETGETYLVGPDKLMRSDSYLDPANHSVKASFANPSLGRVDTEASRDALAGRTDARIIIDYNGNPVLSAYTPVPVGDATWALIAEIDEAEAFAAVNMMRWLVGIIAVVGVAGIISLALLITRSITKPVNRIIEALNSGAQQVASASGQVSAASQSLAEGASENAAALEETSSSLEEMSSMTRSNADNASQANSLMEVTRGTVVRAGESMKEMTRSMEEIASAGQAIGKIIKTIDEIAFQTNLLALNAAVEAARAGEAGQGFAVVADEVRNLAQRAAEAAKNTAELIEGTIRKINHGNELVKTTDEAFSEVTANANKVGELIGEIAAASREQSQGIEQINTAMGQMDTVTQKNAANAEESASASEELNAQAESMHDAVAELVRLISGAKGELGALDTEVARKRIPAQPPQPVREGKRPAVVIPAPAKSRGRVVKADEVLSRNGDFDDF
ncbi:MAG: methyl-accepting chemotaxis protein [Thermodesulfobacteriota bacterium]